ASSSSWLASMPAIESPGNSNSAGSCMSCKKPLGGIIHTYRKFDPVRFPSPTAEPLDALSPAFEHLLLYGNPRELTEDDLARALRLDPGMMAGLGPSLEALMELLRERKRKILSTYETGRVQSEARKVFFDLANQAQPPAKLDKRYREAVRDEQLRD